MQKPAVYNKTAVWNVLIQAAFVLAVMLLLPQSAAQKDALLLGIVLSAFYLFVLFQLLAAFRSQARSTPYSYDTIYYIGFALFVLSVLITHVVLTLRIARMPESYDAREILHLLQGSAK